MSDVFVSYGHAKSAEAGRIAQVLRDLGYAVWRDDDLPVHRDYSDVIEERLRGSKAVLVLWSTDAVKSSWVRAEAEMAREAGTLVQLNLDTVPLPLPFNRIQCADLCGWTGDLQAPAWRKVVESVAELVGAPAEHVNGGGIAHGPLALPDKPSIAVLPLTNLSSDAEQEYFADAVTEDLTTALSRWRSFFVIARNSAFTYKGRAVDVMRIGRELGVRYLLEGSVREVGSRVRINAQLIDAADGTHIWADKFDRDLVDILALQDEITEFVVAAIEPALLRREGARVARKDIRDFTALDCFYRGMSHLNEVSLDGYQKAQAEFREAIARDPELALGHIGLSRILYAGAMYNWSADPGRDLQEAYASAATGIRLDSGDAYGPFALSGAALYLGRQSEALDAAQRAVALNENFAFGYNRLGQVLVHVGRPAEAIAPLERCLRHSPFDPQMGLMLCGLALAHYLARNYAEACTHASAATQHDYPPAFAVLGASLARQGRIEEARRAIPVDLVPMVTAQVSRLVSAANPADRDHLLEGIALAGQAMTAPVEATSGSL
ncbi:TIR domain-containing protein [Phenylobacterium sp.]|jgi:TolB-like protein/Tfp pilus assembly protein PilF|uniref:TIR domain-containing protein n=1 Tax=Phenylobacterium sp. TaxID=1871053 RepID=UPI002F403110